MLIGRDIKKAYFINTMDKNINYTIVDVEKDSLCIDELPKVMQYKLDSDLDLGFKDIIDGEYYVGYMEDYRFYKMLIVSSR